MASTSGTTRTSAARPRSAGSAGSHSRRSQAATSSRLTIERPELQGRLTSVMRTGAVGASATSKSVRVHTASSRRQAGITRAGGSAYGLRYACFSYARMYGPIPTMALRTRIV